MTERPRKSIIEKQCYLMQFLNKHVSFGIDQIQFTNFGIIQTKEPSLIMSKIAQRKGVKDLLDLKPYQMAGLVPRIRIYKVDEINDEEFRSEFQFQDKYNEEYFYSLTSDPSIRSNGIGLKKFNFTLDGKNPAEVQLLTAKMTLFLNNFEDLVTKQENGIAFSDIIKLPGTNGASGIKENEKYNAKDYTIKADIGWSVTPGLDFSPELKEQIERQNLTLFLSLMNHEFIWEEDGRIMLNIDFTGAVESNLNGTLSDIFLSKEAIRLKKEIDKFQKLENIKSQLQELQELDKRSVEVEGQKQILKADAASDDGLLSDVGNLGADALNFFGADIETDRKRIQKRKKALEAEFASIRRTKEFKDRAEIRNKITFLQRELKRDRTKKYARLLANVIGSKELFRIKLNKEQQDNYKRFYNKSISRVNNNTEVKDFGDFLNKVENQVLFGNKPNKEQSKSQVQKRFVPPSPERINLGFLGAGQLSANSIKNTPIDERVKRALELIDETKEIKIDYVYLGTIIDAAIANIWGGDTGFLDSASIITAPMTIKIPKPTTNSDSVEVDFIEYNINLAHLPVSIEYFSEWYISNVIKPQKETYSLRAFIKDIASELIGSISNAICEISSDKEVNTNNRIVDIGVIPLTLPGYGVLESPPIHLDYKPSPQRPLDVSLEGDLGERIEKVKQFNVDELGLLKFYNYLLLVPSEYELQNLAGNPDDDFKRGIYHFHLGKDSGLLKKANFSKIDQPYLREAKIFEDGVNELEVLREKYSANLRLVGNTLFYPFQYLFIDPLLGGLGNPTVKEDAAIAMGLGGYYKVIKIITEMSEAKYETILECYWESYGRLEEIARARVIIGSAAETTKKAIVDTFEAVSSSSTQILKFF